MGRHRQIILYRRISVAITLALATALAGTAALLLQSDSPVAGSGAPANTDERGSGLVDGAGPVGVEVWLDLGCTGCDDLVALVAVLDPLVAEGVVTRTYHPVAPTDDSARLATALGCAADHDIHAQFLAALLEGPDPAPADRTDDELIFLAGRLGVIDPRFAACVRTERYLPWVRYVTGRAAADHVGAIPRISVARAPVETHPAAVIAAVTAAVTATGGSSLSAG